MADTLDPKVRVALLLAQGRPVPAHLDAEVAAVDLLDAAGYDERKVAAEELIEATLRAFPEDTDPDDVLDRCHDYVIMEMRYRREQV